MTSILLRPRNSASFFFSYAAFPGEPITGYEEADFFEFFPRFPYYTPLEKIYGGEDNFFLLPEGVVISIPAVHATGSDHLEALLPYSLAMDCICRPKSAT